MAFLSSLLSVTEPKGFWITIIKAFEGVTKNYVLAIIFLTVVIRLIWGLFETVTKFNSQHMSKIQAKMQPELNDIKKKYANQPQVMQQKQNEIMKKYYGRSYYGSCLISFLVIGLNLLIFFTLFSGLNNMSAYKISSNYDNIKYTYANCLNVADKYWQDDSITLSDKQSMLSDYNNLSFIIGNNEEGKKEISLVHINNGENNILYKTLYKEDFSEKVVVPAEGEGEDTTKTITTNENIIKLIQQYFPVYEEGETAGSKEIIIGSKLVENGENEGQEEPIYLSTALYNSIMEKVVETYDLTQEKFLWIQNIWIADSPINKSIVSFKTLSNQVGKNYFEEGEETIYNSFMPGLKEKRNKTNGYFILPILCIAISVLTMQITNIYNKRKNAKKMGVSTQTVKGGMKWAQIIIPIMLGIFALFYNSVFAIYMLVSQIVSGILIVPQLMFVDYIMDKRENKKKIANEVDYSRKF